MFKMLSKPRESRQETRRQISRVVKIEHFSKVVKSDQHLESPICKIFSSAAEVAVRDGLSELLLLAEEDIKWLGDAALRFEEMASQLHEPKKSHLGLLAAVYRERAGVHKAAVEKLRTTKQPPRSNILNRLIGGLGAQW